MNELVYLNTPNIAETLPHLCNEETNINKRMDFKSCS